MILRFIATLLLSISIFASTVSVSAQDSNNLNIFKIVRFLQYVSSDYVDTLDMDKLIDEAIVEVLKNLDPHSVYITKEDVRAMNEPLEGNFEGIGVEFNIMNDTLMVVNPIPGGPSERVGIMAGDRIIYVDGDNIAGMGIKNSDVFKMLRGDKGTVVSVQVQRKSIGNLLEFSITRDKIPIHSLDAAYMVTPEIGYIKLNRFSQTTVSEFSEALEELKKQKMQHLVLDLRGNGGGYLNAAVELADHFLSQDKIIVYTEGRNSPKTDFKSSRRGNFTKGRLIILLDQGSASASEIVAGAVQDWDRGVIIGRRSFGKGLVQNQVPLPDGSMIRLTVARYYTPTGRVIQKPYESGELESYFRDLSTRYEKGEFFHADSMKLPDSLTYKTLRNQKTVYGGGGIIPDIFIPIDTTFYSDYYGLMVRRGIINQFVHTYVDNNRRQLRRNYSSFNKFDQNFTVTKEMMNDLVTFAQNLGLEPDEEGLKTSESEISRQIRALIAQNLFSTKYYFKIVNQNNMALQKAIEVLNSWESYKHLVTE